MCFKRKDVKEDDNLKAGKFSVVVFAYPHGI